MSHFGHVFFSCRIFYWCHKCFHFHFSLYRYVTTTSETVLEENIHPQASAKDKVRYQCDNCAFRVKSLKDLEIHKQAPCAFIPCDQDHNHDKQRINKIFSDNASALNYVKSKDQFLKFSEKSQSFKCKKLKSCPAEVKKIPENGSIRLVGCIFHHGHLLKSQNYFWTGGKSESPKKSPQKDDFEESFNKDLLQFSTLLENTYKVCQDGISALKEKLRLRKQPSDEDKEGQKNIEGKQVNSAGPVEGQHLGEVLDSSQESSGNGLEVSSPVDEAAVADVSEILTEINQPPSTSKPVANDTVTQAKPATPVPTEAVANKSVAQAKPTEPVPTEPVATDTVAQAKSTEPVPTEDPGTILDVTDDDPIVHFYDRTFDRLEVELFMYELQDLAKSAKDAEDTIININTKKNKKYEEKETRPDMNELNEQLKKSEKLLLEAKQRLFKRCENLQKSFKPFQIDRRVAFDFHEAVPCPFGNALLQQKFQEISKNYEALTTSTDGSCMIHAVNLQVFGTEDITDEVRLRLGIFMVLHEKELQAERERCPWGQTADGTYIANLNYIFAPRAFTNSLAIEALAEMFDIRICTLFPYLSNRTTIFDYTCLNTQYNLKSATSKTSALILYCGLQKDTDKADYEINHFVAVIERQEHQEHSNNVSMVSTNQVANSGDKSAQATSNPIVSQYVPNTKAKSAPAKENKNPSQLFSDPKAASKTDSYGHQDCESSNFMEQQNPEGLEDQWKDDDFDHLSLVSGDEEFLQMQDNLGPEGEEEDWLAEPNNLDEDNEVIDLEKFPFEENFAADINQSSNNTAAVRTIEQEQSFDPKGVTCEDFEKHEAVDAFVPTGLVIEFLSKQNVETKDLPTFPPHGKKLGKKYLIGCLQNVDSVLNRKSCEYNDDYGATAKVVPKLKAFGHSEEDNQWISLTGVKFDDTFTKLVPKSTSKPPKRQFLDYNVKDVVYVKETRRYHKTNSFCLKVTEVIKAPPRFQSAVGRALYEYERGTAEDNNALRLPHGLATRKVSVFTNSIF